jgi:hypothetical protein
MSVGGYNSEYSSFFTKGEIVVIPDEKDLIQYITIRWDGSDPYLCSMVNTDDVEVL